MKFVWDENKRLANPANHELDFADLDLAFFARFGSPDLLEPADRDWRISSRNDRRRRFQAPGQRSRFGGFPCARPAAKKGACYEPQSPPPFDRRGARIQARIAADPDNPEMTEGQMAELRPFAEVCPELMDAIKRSRGRPRVAAPKEAVTLRLSPETIARYKAIGGEDWRARMIETLERAGG